MSYMGDRTGTFKLRSFPCEVRLCTVFEGVLEIGSFAVSQVAGNVLYYVHSCLRIQPF